MKRTTCKTCTLKSDAAKSLSDIEIEILDKSCSQVLFDAGEIIIKQESLSTSVAYVKTGLVKIHIRGPHKKRIIRITKAPAYLCLHSIIGSATNQYSVSALEKTMVCFIDVSIFKKFIFENKEFAYQVLLDISKSHILNIQNLINITQKYHIGRVADTLLFFAKEIYNNASFILPVSRQDLGEMIGITRESVCRILTNFHNEGIIEINGKKIEIKNESLLGQYSENG